MDGVCNRGADNCSPDRHIYNDRFSHVVTNGNGTCELTYVDPVLAERMSKTIRDFDLHIVASTSWRLYYSQEDFKELLTLRGLPGDRLVGYTPNLYRDSTFFGGGCPRSMEIKAFLDTFKEPVEACVIVDDDPEANVWDRPDVKFFQTFYGSGYTEDIDNQVRAWLRAKEAAKIVKEAWQPDEGEERDSGNH